MFERFLGKLVTIRQVETPSRRFKKRFRAKPCPDCGSRSYTRKRMRAFDKLYEDGITIHVYAVTITCKDCSCSIWRGQEESYYLLDLMPEQYRS